MAGTPILYHTPDTCSQAVLIAAREGDVALNIEQVNLSMKTLDDGRNYRAINPLGQVSTLKFKDGSVLTENTAILMWVQSRSQKAGFHRAPDDPDYFQILRWVSFIATEIHKGLFRVVFYDEATDPVKDEFRRLAQNRLAHLNTYLGNRDFTVGDHFSVADAYFVWALNLAPRAGADLRAFDSLIAYRDRLLLRPAVADVIAQEMN